MFVFQFYIRSVLAFKVLARFRPFVYNSFTTAFVTILPKQACNTIFFVLPSLKPYIRHQLSVRRVAEYLSFCMLIQWFGFFFMKNLSFFVWNALIGRISMPRTLQTDLVNIFRTDLKEPRKSSFVIALSKNPLRTIFVVLIFQKA